MYLWSEAIALFLLKLAEEMNSWIFFLYTDSLLIFASLFFATEVDLRT